MKQCILQIAYLFWVVFHPHLEAGKGKNKGTQQNLKYLELSFKYRYVVTSICFNFLTSSCTYWTSSTRAKPSHTSSHTWQKQL